MIQSFIFIANLVAPYLLTYNLASLSGPNNVICLNGETLLQREVWRGVVIQGLINTIEISRFLQE